MNTKGQIRHKYNIFTDECELCGVKKRKKSIVSSGYNPNLKGMMKNEYSKDGINWTQEFINCTK